tara:strand:+ start:3851 stop:5029 length:1179 start_codon:yes stop_codon:yes gene_type:complete
LTRDEFIERARKIHSNRFDYSKVVFKGVTRKISIICLVHGSFQQTPAGHLSGRGCRKCGSKIAIPPMTQEEFVKKAKAAYGDRYNYSETIYRNYRTKIKAKCNLHGCYFWVTPRNHIQGRGCKVCGKISGAEELSKLFALTAEEFILAARSIHGRKYDYSRVDYKNSATDIWIGCSMHGFWSTRPGQHIYKGSGCPQCGIETTTRKCTHSLEDFIEKAGRVHGQDKFDYSKVDYCNSGTKVCIVCNDCKNDFWQMPAAHLSNHGCPYCKRKNEKLLYALLKIQFSFCQIKTHYKIWDSYRDYKHRRYCDFWLENLHTKVMIEYDGEQHFKPVRFNSISQGKAEKIFERQKKVDKLDAEFCKQNNILLWRVRYDDNKEKSVKKLKKELKKIAA